MAGVDTSIYGQLQQPANPLAMAQGFADYQSKLQQNRLSQMAIEGQQGLGAAAKSAFDPITGAFDPAKFGQAAAAGSPYAASAIATQQMDLQGKLQDITNKARINAGLVLGSQMSTDNYDGVAWSKAIQAASASGAINPQVTKEILQAIADTGGDPDKLKAAAQRYVVQAMGAGAWNPSVPVATGAGGTQYTPPAAIVGQTKPATAGGSVNSPAGGAPPAPIPPPNAMTAFSAPGSLPPQAQQAFDRVNQRIQAGDASGRRLALLQQLDRTNDQFTSGPAADDLMTMAKLFNELTGSNLAVDATNAADVFKKTAIQFASSQGMNLPATDLGALERLEANPNTAMAHDAIHQIVGKLMGIEEMNLAAQKLFQNKQGQGADVQAQAATDWSQHENPLVFQFPHMSPKEQADQVKSLKAIKIGGGKSAWDKFYADYRWFHDNGLAPGQGAANAQ